MATFNNTLLDFFIVRLWEVALLTWVDKHRTWVLAEWLNSLKNNSDFAKYLYKKIGILLSYQAKCVILVLLKIILRRYFETRICNITLRFILRVKLEETKLVSNRINLYGRGSHELTSPLWKIHCCRELNFCFDTSNKSFAKTVLESVEFH